MVKRKTPEEYVTDCKEKNLDPPIEDYINAKTKIKHKCKNGHIYKQTPHNHLLGRGCKYCTNRVITPEMYLDKCKSLNLDLPVEDYTNKNTAISFKCNKCGKIYKQRPDAHINQKQGHRDCYFSSRRETYLKHLRNCETKQYDIPVENTNSYNDGRHYMKYQCSNCGLLYNQRIDLHLEGHGCPICNESHGEKFIRNYLDKHSIKYEPQKTFKDLKDKQVLSYDFYLPDYTILIEYQGIQHYESVSFNGKQGTDLEKQQYHDKLKKDYAKKNHYKLLELHYSLDTQEKVNKYLKRRIKD